MDFLSVIRYFICNWHINLLYNTFCLSDVDIPDIEKNSNYKLAGLFLLNFAISHLLSLLFAWIYNIYDIYKCLKTKNDYNICIWSYYIIHSYIRHFLELIILGWFQISPTYPNPSVCIELKLYFVRIPTL